MGIKVILVLLALTIAGCYQESDGQREARIENFAERYYANEYKNKNGDIILDTLRDTILIHEFKTNNDKRCVIVTSHRGTALSCEWN